MKKNTAEYIYGVHAVESMLKNNCESVLQLWISKGRNDKRVRDVAGEAERAGVSIEAISVDKMNKKCPDANHQGVIAKIRPAKINSVGLEDILGKQSLLLLILDEVQDPHNIGACLRTADAAGVDAVIVSRNRSPGITAVVRKVASGAAETVPFVQVSNLARTIRQLQDDGIHVIGTSDDADITIYDSHVTERTALVMGSEGKGIRRLTRESCDELVSIPMRGSVESLNVSVATGIALFEIRRKLEVSLNP
jgi:23S rRNA (guanosine2251-2'-O)-methyltransferase